MVACQTRLNIPGQVSGVRLTCRGSKSGQMALFLDARMRSLEIQKGQSLLKVSWTTFEKPGNNTTLGLGVTYPVSILLSDEAQDFEYFKYSEGEYFQSKQGTIYRLDGLVLTEDGKMVYLLTKKGSKGKRFVSQESLEEGYSIIQQSTVRFALIDIT